MEDRCLICGAIIPEGIHVCPLCETKLQKSTQNAKISKRNRKTTKLPFMLKLRKIGGINTH